jgi:hypothetical protein
LIRATGPRTGVWFTSASGPQDIRVSEVWDSHEQLDAFGEKLRPRMEEAGIQLSGQPEVFEAHIFETF